jgi:hypothetical protein
MPAHPRSPPDGVGLSWARTSRVMSGPEASHRRDLIVTLAARLRLPRDLSLPVLRHSRSDLLRA